MQDKGWGDAVKQKIVTYIVLIGFLAATLFLVNLYRRGQDGEVRQVSEKKEKMLKTIAQYKDKERLYSEEFGVMPQPVKNEEIDRLQNALIKKMGLYGIKVESLTKQPDAPPPVAPSQATNEPPKPILPKSVVYEAVVVSQWPQIMAYLMDLRHENALIVVTSLRMEAATTGEAVKTTFNYKVYKE